MKNLRKLSGLVVALLFTTVMMAQDKNANNIDDSKIALQGYSPVSYLDLNLAQRGVKDFKSEHEGITYYFTSKEQKATFDKNPSKYLPQYGGYCAFGVSVGAKFRVDPNKFVVSNGKYYLFLNDIAVDAKQLWVTEKDEAALIKKANDNWKTLKTK